MYHVRPIENEHTHHAHNRMTSARHFVCCFMTPRYPKWGQKFGPHQTLEVPHKSKFKWIGTPHWLYKTTWQTYCLLQRARKPPPNIGPCSLLCKIRREQMLNVPCKTNRKWTYTSCTQQNDTCQTFCLLLYDPQICPILPNAQYWCMLPNTGACTSTW